MPCRDDWSPNPVRHVTLIPNVSPALLYSACAALEALGFDFRVNPELDSWWAFHKEEDRKRVEALVGRPVAVVVEAVAHLRVEAVGVAVVVVIGPGVVHHAVVVVVDVVTRVEQAAEPHPAPPTRGPCRLHPR